jgi:hypothetical protein
MKKLLLFAGVMGLSLQLAIAQAPGAYPTYAYDDFQQVLEYTNTTGGGIYWYSSNASVVNGTRAIGSATFAFTNTAAGQTFLSADFGSNSGGALTIDLTSQSDIQVDIQNTSNSDLQLRVHLKDISGNYLDIEPNISDCIGVPDFATPDPNATWSTQNVVYPVPSSYPNAVYPTVAYNGFIIPANKRDTYRIDLSSVPTAKGGRIPGNFLGTNPLNSPESSVAVTAQFDISQIHAVEFVFNENTAFNLSDKGLDTTSYKYDAQGIKQINYTGSIVFYSFKVGSILPALGQPSPVTGFASDAVVDGSLKAYPNPAKETLNVSFESGSAATVSLTDVVGYTAYTATAVTGQNQMNVNTSNLTKGMYILNVTTDQGRASRKISIQ